MEMIGGMVETAVVAAATQGDPSKIGSRLISSVRVLGETARARRSMKTQ